MGVIDYKGIRAFYITEDLTNQEETLVLGNNSDGIYTYTPHALADLKSLSFALNSKVIFQHHLFFKIFFFKKKTIIKSKHN